MKKLELSKRGTVNKGKFALVDDDIFEEVNKYNWSWTYGKKSEIGYAKQDKKLHIFLHVYVWKLKNGEIPEGFEVDHIDRDGLNCQISNLRLATKSENCCNREKNKKNKSGYKGISKHVRKQSLKNGTEKEYIKWTAEVSKDKRKGGKTYTKEFPYTEEGLKEAVDWYKQKSLELQKEFSIYNKDK